jgi:phosphate/sulfate permease
MGHLNARFNPIQASLSAIDQPAFDMLRASINLSVASVLISLATSLQLPLSTTYVSFMVAMGTSLADRAWNTSSAANRISGVMNVVGGWLLTAIIAFTVAFLFATLIHFGGALAILFLVGGVFYSVYRTFTWHRKQTK